MQQGDDACTFRFHPESRRSHTAACLWALTIQQIVLAAQIRRSSCSQAALQEASNRISAHCPTRQVFNQIRKLNLPNAKLHSLPGCADRFQLSYHTRWKLWSTAMHA